MANVSVAGACPECGTRRTGAFRFCLTCGFDYDDAVPAVSGTSEDSTSTITDPETSEPAAEPVSAVRSGRVASSVVSLSATFTAGRRPLLALACFAGIVTIVTADADIPEALRIVLALSVVFILPGFAATSAIPPASRMASTERLLVSIGMSLVIATCMAVFLALTPIGLSRVSFAAGLGATTIGLSAAAFVRSITERHWGLSLKTPGTKDTTSEGVRPEPG